MIVQPGTTVSAEGDATDKYLASTSLRDCFRQLRTQDKGAGLGKEGIRMTPAWGGASGTNDLEEEGDQLWVCEMGWDRGDVTQPLISQVLWKTESERDKWMDAQMDGSIDRQMTDFKELSL